MCFNLPFKNTGASVDDYLFQLVEKLNATEFGAYSVFREVEKAIDSEKVPEEKQDKSVMAGYAALKSLVIKTGDYVVSHSDTFSKTFSGSYLTVSEFGTYKEQMENRITVDETGITQLYDYTADLDTRATTLEGDTEELGQRATALEGETTVLDTRATALEGETEELDGRATTLESDTEGINNNNGKWSVATKQYVKTGLLYYDEDSLPVYGVGVGVIDTTVSHGEQVINMATSELLTHTANEIGFWQGGSKVAYIRAKKLYLPDAEIMGGSIDIGNGDFTVDANGNMVAKSATIDGGAINGGTITGGLITNSDKSIADVQFNLASGTLRFVQETSDHNNHITVLNAGGLKLYRQIPGGEEVIHGYVNLTTEGDAVFVGQSVYITDLSDSYARLIANTSNGAGRLHLSNSLHNNIIDLYRDSSNGGGALVLYDDNEHPTFYLHNDSSGRGILSIGNGNTTSVAIKYDNGINFYADAIWSGGYKYVPTLISGKYVLARA